MSEEMTPLEERIREIVTDCLITAYHKVNPLVDKYTGEIITLLEEEKRELVDALERIAGDGPFYPETRMEYAKQVLEKYRGDNRSREEDK